MGSFASQSGFTDNLNTTALQNLENACWQWSARMGFQQVRLPLIENRSVYERGVGAGTDVVEKEMFALKGTDNVLRPESTAQAMRAWLAAGAVRYGQARWAYCGPMFRNERPQAGRFRQFTQFGCETIMQPEGPGDADMLIGLNDLFLDLGVRDKLVLKINTLGTAEERRAYRDALVAWLEPQAQSLDDDSKKRLQTNPLRIFDSKDVQTQTLMASAPRLREYLGDESAALWQNLLDLLNEANISYQVDDGLMRGLDYYNSLVFEWVTFENKAQNAVAAGGRYDGLSQSLGGPPTPAYGFAIGLERLLVLQVPQGVPERSGYYVAAMPGNEAYAMLMARAYRQRGCTVVFGEKGQKLTKQVQRADKLSMRYVIIIGDAEREGGFLTVKDLMTGEQSVSPLINDGCDVVATV
jgi:histidyl-tRNA synthetase